MQSEKSDEITDSVFFDKEKITRRRIDGYTEIINWDDLYKVEVITTDEGPFLEDVFILLLNKDETNGCVVSQSSEGFDKFLKELQKLPNFDNKEFINAMSSVSNDRFICWLKEDEHK